MIVSRDCITSESPFEKFGREQIFGSVSDKGKHMAKLAVKQVFCTDPQERSGDQLYVLIDKETGSICATA